MKYLSINLKKYVQDVCDENYITEERNKKDLNKWRGMLCSWTNRLSIVKISVLPI